MRSKHLAAALTACVVLSTGIGFAFGVASQPDSAAAVGDVSAKATTLASVKGTAKKALKKANKALKAAKAAQGAVGNISIQYASGFSTVFPGGYGGTDATCPEGSYLLDIGADYADKELRLVQQGPINPSGTRGVVIYHNPSSLERLFRVTATCLRGVGVTP